MKQNKIIVCQSIDDKQRRLMIQRAALKLNLAVTPHDANKLIRDTPYDYNLTGTYIVLAHNFNFNQSPHTTHTLYQLASRGIAVIVGAKRIPHPYEFMCEIYTETEI